MLLSFGSALLSLALLTLVLAIRKVILAVSNPLNRIPGPFLARFTNIPLKIAVITGRRIHYVDALHKRYGPYVRVSPNEVADNDPEGFKQIHAIGSGFEKSGWYPGVVGSPRPTLFTMTDKQEHAKRRRLIARGFSKSNIRQNWEGPMTEKIKLAVTKIKEEAQKAGGVVDVLKWWIFMSSDISSLVLLGDCFHTLENGEINQYIRALTSAQKRGGLTYELPLVEAIGKRLPFQAARELWIGGDCLLEYAKIAVQIMKSNQMGTNIFANIIAEAEKSETLDDFDVQLETSALFVAGTETTAISLTYLIWAVLRDPALRTRIEAEVATLPTDFSDADVESQCPLVNAVIEETLRLYGAAPGALPRAVPAGGREMGGYFLTQDNIVSTQAYSMHRDPAIFPNPFAFKPERWLPDHKDSISAAARQVFSPFGTGSKNCLGIHMAYMDLRIATVEFFRRCPGSTLAPSTTDKSMELENFFLIQPKAHQCEILLNI